MDGWAGAHNPHPHYNPPPHIHTILDMCVRDGRMVGWTHKRMDGLTNGQTEPLIDLRFPGLVLNERSFEKFQNYAI